MENKIPKGWKAVKLGDVVEHVKDKVPDRNKWTFDRYIGGEHFNEGEIRITKSAPIEGNEEVIGSAFHMRFKRGQVLYVTRNPRLRKGGIVDFEGVCSNVTFTLEAKEDNLLQKLLPFIIQTESFTKHACNSAHGSTNPFLNWKDIASYDLLLPPINEQKKISEVLWGIENSIESLERYNYKLNEIKLSLIKKILVTGFGKINHKDSELGSIPKNWKIIKLQEGVKEFQYGLSMPMDDSGKYQILKMDNLVDGKIVLNPLKYVNLDLDTFNKFKLFKGDVLFNRTNSFEYVGRTSIFDLDKEMVFASYLIRLKVDTAILNPSYLSNYLNLFNDQLKQIATRGVQQANINATNLANFKIILPTLEEQSKIVEIITKIEVQKSNLISQLKVLNSIRQKLMNELLLGKIRLE